MQNTLNLESISIPYDNIWEENVYMVDKGLIRDAQRSWINCSVWHWKCVCV